MKIRFSAQRHQQGRWKASGTGTIAPRCFLANYNDCYTLVDRP
jgi:hypothetical protein